MISLSDTTAAPARVPAERFATFQTRLDSAGLRHALSDILMATDYRYIGIFRFDNGMANSVVHYDRQNPEVLDTSEVLDTATYCCYVRDSQGAFTTADALQDPRLGAHPARGAVRAYCGVPIMDDAGAILGTLCHYDDVPRDPRQIDLELMIQVAAFLARDHTLPAYRR
ncbi:MAG TPA: GAF domain-containing protein [Rubrivivax sp.]